MEEKSASGVRAELVVEVPLPTTLIVEWEAAPIQYLRGSITEFSLMTVTTLLDHGVIMAAWVGGAAVMRNQQLTKVVLQKK